MCGFKILYEISKGTFEITHKLLNPYTAKYEVYCLLFLRLGYDIFELWRHKPQSDGPLMGLKFNYNTYNVFTEWYFLFVLDTHCVELECVTFRWIIPRKVNFVVMEIAGFMGIKSRIAVPHKRHKCRVDDFTKVTELTDKYLIHYMFSIDLLS